MVYIVLQITLTALAAAGNLHVDHIFKAATAIKLLVAISMVPLTVAEHSRSPQPSMLLNGFLLISLLLDATQSRTLYLLSYVSAESTYSNLFVTALAVEAVMLLLESQQKTRWIRWDKNDHSPEETSGIFSLGVFLWLNRLFWRGYGRVLSISDLYALDGNMDPTRLHDKFSKNLDRSKLKGDKYGLTKALIRTLIGPLLVPMIPRLTLFGFQFAQPFFIERLLDYLAQDKLDPNIGYGFIGASFFIYCGIMLSWAFHRQVHFLAF